MRDIDNEVMLAQKDKRLYNNLILKNEAFIINSACKSTGKYITKLEDEWSVALCAFDEAVKNYDFDKGSFYSFAELVIKRRLIDYYKKQSKIKKEISLDTFTLDGNTSNEENTMVNKQLLEKLSFQKDESIKLEIEELSGVLNSYGFSFFDLVDNSPKAEKTKTACGKAIRYASETSAIIEKLHQHKTLPLKDIEKNTKAPRKLLERHRKYIIAGIEIVIGDYPNLSEYLSYVRKEL